LSGSVNGFSNGIDGSLDDLRESRMRSCDRESGNGCGSGNENALDLERKDGGRRRTKTCDEKGGEKRNGDVWEEASENENGGMKMR
jgi:hypothetical protein